jgi:hypothetical protein
MGERSGEHIELAANDLVQIEIDNPKANLSTISTLAQMPSLA